MYVDVAQERTHNALIAGVENFKPSSLKRTDTKEKIVLPNAQGKLRGGVNPKQLLVKPLRNKIKTNTSIVFS